MCFRWLSGALALAIGALAVGGARPARACCTVSADAASTINGSQSVLLIWDPQTQTEHFIRQASFKSAVDRFGFLVPTPSRPELGEADAGVFKQLATITAAERIKKGRTKGGRSAKSAAVAPSVRVVEQRLVAGYDAAVLQASGAAALVEWLRTNGYAYSPEVEAWAKPYVDAGWMITALKLAKDTAARPSTDVAAAALRLTFKTDRLLFPYREPDSKLLADKLNRDGRLLRIYVVADARYAGSLAPDHPWTGRAVWAGKLRNARQTELLKTLALSAENVRGDWFLTEFEDPWPYGLAPADLYFARDALQDEIRRPPVIEYGSIGWPERTLRNRTAIGAGIGIAIAALLTAFLRSRRGYSNQ